VWRGSNGTRSVSCAGEKAEGGLKDGLANHWKSKNIMKKALAARGQETKWETRLSARENDDPDYDIL